LSLPALLAAGAAAAALAAGSPGLAAGHVSAAGVPPPHVISLHRAYQAAAPQATARRIAGVMPPRGKRVSIRHASAAASCAEPDCDLVYGGGPVQHSPHVYLLLWGPDWTSSSTAYVDLYYLYAGLGVPTHDTWSTITSQYGDGSGHPGFSGSVFEGAWQDGSPPPDPVTPDDLAAEADGLASQLGISDRADAQIVVASQSGTCFSDGFAGSCGAVSPSGVYCGWHAMSSAGVPFTNLPYQLDAGTACGKNWINSGSAGTYDGFSTVAGHEYAESVTDPEAGQGWSDPADGISGGEIADKCAWGGRTFGVSDPKGDVTLSTGTFAMQSLWSNAAGRCVLTSAPHVTVTSPGTQKSTLGRGVSLQIHASTNTGTALSYKASGLPDGLSINGSIGKITGTPGTTAGTFTATVTVSSYASSATVTFSWPVSSAAGPVTGYGARCADDYADHSTNGNKIDLWSCDGQGRQQITFAASGELQVAGKCVTAGGAAALEACARSAAQTWTRRANGEYVAASNGQCLTDPGNATANGTQLRVAACTDAAGQRWSLP
jgi:Ricin-type beta-trefoil lectin domain/Putative Ig domain